MIKEVWSRTISFNINSRMCFNSAKMVSFFGKNRPTGRTIVILRFLRHRVGFAVVSLRRGTENSISINGIDNIATYSDCIYLSFGGRLTVVC